jgi:hypothetical protein
VIDARVEGSYRFGVAPGKRTIPSLDRPAL